MHILRNDQYFRYGDDDFQVQTRRPGLISQDFDREDYAFGPLSRIDHVHLAPDYLIEMHLHHNDEILSYIYKGEMLHRDTENNKVLLTPDKLRVMNAGPASMKAPMTIRNEVVVFDAHGSVEDEVSLPSEEGMTPWLYVMDGSVEVLGVPP